MVKNVLDTIFRTLSHINYTVTQNNEKMLDQVSRNKDKQLKDHKQILTDISKQFVSVE